MVYSGEMQLCYKVDLADISFQQLTAAVPQT